MQAVHVAPLPPHAAELERSVLGKILLDPRSFGEVADFLSFEHFYLPEHRAIYKAMQGLSERGTPIDTGTVAHELVKARKLDEIGGAYYLSKLSLAATPNTGIQHHARILQQYFMTRVYRELGARLVDIHESEDVFDVFDEIQEKLASVTTLTNAADPVNTAELLGKIVDDRSKPLYITSDMGQLDAHFSMGPNHITVVGARPSVGKTAFALNMAANIARQGYPVLFISLEMSALDIAARFASMLTGVDSERVTIGEMTEEDREVVSRANTVNGKWTPRIWIDDRATLDASQVFGVLNKASKKYGCQVAIVDYLQLMTGPGVNFRERLSNISMAFKHAAKATGVRVVELSQLSRGKDSRDPMVDPSMSDLRESGQIEADGDTIILLGRAKGSEQLLVKIDKNKKGPVGSVEMVYNLSRQLIGPSPAPSTFTRSVVDHTEPTRDQPAEF